MSISHPPATQHPGGASKQIQDLSQRDARTSGEVINGKPSYTVTQAADQINLQAQERWPDRDGNGKTQLSYTFAERPGATFEQNGLINFSAFNSQQKEQARRALQSWSDVAKLSFTEKPNDGTGDGHLTFGNFQDIQGVEAPNGKALTVFDPSSQASQSWYRAGGYDENLTASLNSRGRQTLTHEIGHQVGLQHPGSYGGPNSGYASDAQYVQDSMGHSLMSYWDERETGHDFRQGDQKNYPSAPQMDDIRAIQRMYGANHETRTTDTVYGFDSNTERDFYSASSPKDPIVASIWDAGGHDSLNFSRYTQDQKINLNAASFSDVGGMTRNVSIAPGVTLEDAYGGDGNDVMLGNEASNLISGGDGNDVIDGGAGSDTLWGGQGRNTFVFSHAQDSTPAAADRIMDFVSGQDSIDVSNIRAATGQPALSYVSDFTGRAGEAMLTYHGSSNQSSLAIDTQGKGVADFMVKVRGEVRIKDIVA